MTSIATRAPFGGISAYDVAATGGRLLLAAIFLLSGYSKLVDPAATIGYIQSVGLPFAELGVAVAIVVELVGGALLVVGYKARLAAAALALFTIVAAVFFHPPGADQGQFIHFFKNVAITGGLLQVIALGAGRLSLEGRSQPAR